MATKSPYNESYYAQHGLAGDRIALWFYARLVRRMRPKGGRLLDFGCGTGHLLRRLFTTEPGTPDAPAEPTS